MPSALIVDNGTDCLPQLISMIKLWGYDAETVPTARYGGEEADLVVLSGGLWFDDNLKNEEVYRKLINRIPLLDCPLLGICLGLHLIALAYGGETEDLPKRRHGLITLDRYKLFQNHSRACITAPPEFDNILRSGACIEIFQHRSRPILGVQFHPELDPGGDGEELVRHLIQGFSRSA